MENTALWKAESKQIKKQNVQQTPGKKNWVKFLSIIDPLLKAKLEPFLPLFRKKYPFFNRSPRYLRHAIATKDDYQKVAEREIEYPRNQIIYAK